MLVCTTASSAQELEVISADSNGQLQNVPSNNSFVSGNGRYVIFESSFLLPEDTFGAQVYLRDRETGTLELISSTPLGLDGNSSAELPVNNNATAISDDGNLVLFRSRSSDLIPGVDPGGIYQLFLRDRQNQTTTVISTAPDGITLANGNVGEFTMAADGSHLVFNSSASNLDPEDPDTFSNTFLHILSTGVTQLACFKPGAGPGDKEKIDNCSKLAISCTGGMVFTSSDDEVVNPPLSLGSPRQLFVGLLLSGADNQVLVKDYNGQISTFAENGASISCDGQRIAFSTRHPMVISDTNATWDTYVLGDWQGVQVWRTYDTSGAPTLGRSPRLSSNGKWLSFTTPSSLDPLDDNSGNLDVYQLDFRGDIPGPVRYISHAAGSAANLGADFPTSSNNGVVAFRSVSTNLTLFPDTNGNPDIFALQTSTLFADDFSSGDTSAWSSVVSNDMAITQAAAADAGGYGLHFTPGGSCASLVDVLVTGPSITGTSTACDTLTADNAHVVVPGADFNAGLDIRIIKPFSVATGATLSATIDNSLTPRGFVVDDSPVSETSYNARFQMNLNAMTIGAADRMEVFRGYSASGQREFSLFLEMNGLSMEVFDSAAYTVSGTPVTVPSSGWFEVLVSWQADSTNGQMSLSIDRGIPLLLDTLANGNSRIDAVRLGIVDGLIPSASGFYLDDFVSWR